MGSDVTWSREPGRRRGWTRERVNGARPAMRADDELDVARRRRRRRRRRCGARRGRRAGCSDGPGGAARLRVRHVLAVVKLIHGGLRYLEMLDFGLVREALHRARPAARAARAAPRPAGAVPLPADPACWERPYVGAGLLCTTRMALRWARRGVPHHRHLTRRGRCGSRRRCGATRRRRDPVLGRPGRRRPARDAMVAHRGGLRRPGRLPRQGRRLPARGRAGHRRTGPRPGDRRASSRSGPGRWSTRPACGPTTIQELVGGRGKIHVRGVQGHAPRRAARPDPLRERAASCAPRSRVLFVIPWGRHWIIGTTDTAWDLDKAHPAASSAPTSTTCSSTSTPCSASRSTHEDVEGVYAGLRPLLSGESEATSKISREHTVAAPGAGPGVDRGRQVHDVPRDGPDAVDAVGPGLDGEVPSLTDRVAAGRRRRLPGALERRATGWPRVRPARRAHRAPAAGGTAR